MADEAATLTFTIDNSANGSAASALDFSNTLVSGLLVAGTPNAATTCTGGTLTATAGSGSISYTGGSVSGGATCTVTVDVAAASDGTYVNTSGALTSSFGTSTTSSATLTVASPEIDLQRPASTSIADGGSDAQGSVAVGVQQVLTYTVANTGAATLTLTGSASSSGASNVSVDSISAPGSSTVAASGSTTFTVSYTPTAAGAFSFDLSLASDDADEASYDITVSGTATAVPGFSQAVSPSTVLADEAATLTFTIDNSANGSAASALDFSNTLVSGLLVAGTPNAATTCTGGTLTATAGSGSISYTGGSVSGGATCTVTVDVAAASDGTYVNTSGALTSSFGTSTTSSATLTVASPEIDLQRPASTSIADGGSDAQGSVAVGVQQVLTYTVANTGAATLTLTGSASSSGASNVSVDSISAPGSSTVAASGSTTFTVSYTPTAAGAFSFDLSLASDDADEASYDITVSGTATDSGNGDIEIGSSLGGPVEDGDTDTVPGTPSPGAVQTIVYTISNPSSTVLTITTPSVASHVSNVFNVVVEGFTLGSRTVPVGGSTTLEVRFTPAAAGPFGFEFMVPYNLARDSGFTIKVAGTAIGAPEIEVTTSSGGAVVSGQTDTLSSAGLAGIAETVTYKITNSGTDRLTLTQPTVAGDVSGQSNVTVNSLVLGATSLASGGSTTLVVGYTPNAAGRFGFQVSLENSDTDESPFVIAVSGSATAASTSLQAVSGSGQLAEIDSAFSNPLVARVLDAQGKGVAGVAVTFLAPASGASVRFASSGGRSETVTTGRDGRARSSILTANSVASTYANGGLETYRVTASAEGLTSVSYLLTNLRDEAADIETTQQVIANYVSNRANTIVSGQPNLVSRLTMGAFSRQRGVNGLSFSAREGGYTGQFQFSLRAFTEHLRRSNTVSDWQASLRGGAAASSAANLPGLKPRLQSPALGYASRAVTEADNTAEPMEPVSAAQSGWDFWAEGRFAVTENMASSSKTGLFFAGVDYRWGDQTVAGVMGQLDITEEDNALAGTSVEGVGWMVGPYVVTRLSDRLYFDAAATYGRSSNQINALGLFEDDFATERLLIQAGLTGEFALNPRTTFSPFARVIYYRETQEAYTDSLGRVIPEQNFDLGRLEFGPKLSWDVYLKGQNLLTPYVSLSGIYDFNKLQTTNASDPSLASSDSDLRARLEFGATYIVPDRNIQVSFEGFYDGIGVSDFESFGASINIEIPF
ncbi:choice-of-anchor D domain-containing protein [Arenibacterium sp. LLYu02]|uniref:DUF7933 domain-containing protein n=1 Tax=Arenibacterium sp. LLYu02 TaxID=3404132 RepID=UPI003B21A4B9